MEIKELIEFLESIKGFVIYYSYDERDGKINQIIEKLQNLDMLISQNPYPEDVFLPIPKEDFDKINDLLKKEMGYSIDRLSGNMGRRIYKSIIEQLKG